METAVRSEDEWCFGMVTGIHPRLLPRYIIQQLPVALDTSDDFSTLIDARSRNIFGTVSSTTSRILSVLSKELSLQIFADRDAKASSRWAPDRPKPSSKTANTEHINLNLVLYGPSQLFEPVGVFANKCGIYLQHPRHCDRDVPYRNPHCLSPENETGLSTSDLHLQLDVAYSSWSEATANPIDLFLDAGQQEDLAESAIPDAVLTSLYKHQRQALTFMLRRESGWALDGRYKDIWKAEVNSQGQLTYSNNITGQKQTRPPEQFRGGLLIDAPGLGKSLSIIALVATDLHRLDEEPDAESKTLLVVPKSLLETWKRELQRHLKPSSTVRHCVYYGKNRKKLLEHLEEYTMLITTYSVVRMDWKATLIDHSTETFRSLHVMKWRRVVLDEAHIAREPSKSFSKSVCALRADRRWAVTGTPIQNRLTDLYSLFKFLQCSPFSNLNVFNRHVTQNWKARSEPYSVAKLKNLVNCLSIRRPKNIIELPPRQDNTVELEFDDTERQLYEQVKSRTLHLINQVDQKVGGESLFHVLRWVNQLRLVCNHGLQSKAYAAHTVPPQKSKGTWNQKAAQARFDHMDVMGWAKCSNPDCGQDLSSAASSEIDNEHEDEPYIKNNLTVLCSTCHTGRGQAPSQFLKVCNHFPRRSLGDGTAEYQEIFEADDQFSISQSHSVSGQAGQVSSKIKRILQDLVHTPENVKSVVFSSWTKTLDILQPQLGSRSIRCLRLDGTLSATKRENVLRAFRIDPGIKVLLATIACGGVGLDLTAASRAYIIEPQWNPMSESQALDRVHRLGQTNEVITTRYVMKKTWEEQVLTVQRRKQELADLTLSSGSIDKAELTYQRLQYLKEIVG